MNIDDETIKLIRRALDQSADALGCLRRGYGLDVTNLCYPAKNTVHDAMRALAALGVCEEEPELAHARTPRAQQVARIEALINRVAKPSGTHWVVDWGKPGVRKVD